MNTSHPPRLPAWLLERLVSGQQRESLVGDLLEQFQHGRSAAWFWRQTVKALVATARGDIRNHPVLTLRALVVGFTIYFLSSLPVLWLSLSGPSVRNVPLIWLQNWLLETGHDSLRGWTFKMSLLSIEVFQQTLTLAASAISGWVVARLHSRHAPSMVFAFAVSVGLYRAVEIAVRLTLDGGRHSMPLHTFLPLTLFFVLGRPMSILLGGLLGTDVPRDTSERSLAQD